MSLAPFPDFPIVFTKWPGALRAPQAPCPPQGGKRRGLPESSRRNPLPGAQTICLRGPENTENGHVFLFFSRLIFLVKRSMVEHPLNMPLNGVRLVSISVALLHNITCPISDGQLPSLRSLRNVDICPDGIDVGVRVNQVDSNLNQAINKMDVARCSFIRIRRRRVRHVDSFAPTVALVITSTSIGPNGTARRLP